MRPLNISALYGDFADEYTRFSMDRDFAAQVRRLVELHGERRTELRSLELFAGPAEHSRAFVVADYGTAIAIDNVAAMAEAARRVGGAAEIQYLIARLPVIPDEIAENSLDIVFAPRYSLGYLTIDETATLLQRCTSILREDGIFVAELHNPRNFLDHLNTLDIKTRSFRTASGARGRVEWPSGPVRLRPEGWIAEMDVRLELDDHPRPYVFTSVEHLHTMQSLRFACRDFPNASFQAQPLSFEEFAGSLLVVYRKVG
jgi:SAM-dependent methyltransferase